MRGGNQEMDKQWLSGNSYLRLLSSLPQEPKKVMTFCMQSVQELQLVLEAIQKLDKYMSTGKGNPEKPKWVIEISLRVDASKETST